MKFCTKIILFVISLTCLTFAIRATGEKRIVSHPSELRYEEFGWKIPTGKEYRKKLRNRLNLYISEDKGLPLVSFNGYFYGGTLLDPQDKAGLGSMAVRLMRTGGTKKYPADTLDELIDYYAISFSIAITGTQIQVKGEFLSKFTDEALDIIEQILFYPVFDEEKIKKEKEFAIQGIKHRFDDPAPVLSAAYKVNMYNGMVNSILTTEQSIKAITRNDFIRFHKKYFKTENALLAITGDFSQNDMEKKLQQIFPRGKRRASKKEFPQIDVKPKAKYLIVHKKITQAYVRIGHEIFQRPHNDYYALTVVNKVLGGSSFASRLTTSVRSDAGLTYSIYSTPATGYTYPGTFYINFSTKSSTVNQAIALSLKEVRKMNKNGVTEQELESAKKMLVSTLPSYFRTKSDVLDTYAWSEYYNRSDDHFTVYPDKINALSVQDVLKASQKHIKPNDFTYVIVGDTTELFKAPASDGFSLKDLKPMVISEQDLYEF